MISRVDLSRVLVGAPYDTPLRVRHIAFEAVRHRCAERGIHVGDEVRRVGATESHVVLEVPDRGPVHLEVSLSTCVEVEPMPVKTLRRSA